MATINIAGLNGFDTNLFWIEDSGASRDETFSGLLRSSGGPLVGHQEQIYSTFSFLSNGFTYRYIGEFTITADRGVLSGTISAQGFYNRIEVLSGDTPIATYQGDPLTVNFGTNSGAGVLGLLGNLVGGVTELLFGGSQSESSYPNLHLAATPNLPDIAFAGGLVATGGVGPDTITGSTGNDNLSGGAGDDFLVGGAGNDLLVGQAGSDRLYGSGGDDYLYGQAGNDFLYGEAGTDILVGGTGADLLDGGDGLDYASYTDAASGVSARLSTPSLNTGEAAGDIYVGIEGLIGSQFQDLLVGNEQSNVLLGQGGDDAIFGFGGYDEMYGGAGADKFYFRAIDLPGAFATVRDFNASEGDGLVFQDVAPASLATYQLGADAVIQLADGTGGVVVSNTTLAQLEGHLLFG